MVLLPKALGCPPPLVHNLGLTVRRHAAGSDGDGMTSVDPPDPATPNPAEPWPVDAPPTPRQDHAVLGWLVVHGDLPESVRRQLLAALTAWEPLMGEALFPVEPLAGPDCDVADLLEAQWWRRAEQAESARWHDRVALVEVCGRLGLAIADVRGRRVGQEPPDGL
jgi:hypothetical protein